MKLNVKAFSITSSLLAGIGLFLFTWWVIIFEGVSKSPTIIGLVYRGYTISPLGSVIGLAWALADGAIVGAIFAWLYNLLSAKKQQA